MISESDESGIFNFLQRFHVFLETEQVFHRETSGRRAAGSLDTTLHMFSDCFSDRTFKRDVIFHHQSTEEVFFVLMCFKTQSFSNIRGESRLKTTKRLSSQSEDQHRNCTLTFLLNLREASRCSNPPRVSGRRLMNLRHHDNSSTVTAR